MKKTREIFGETSEERIVSETSKERVEKFKKINEKDGNWYLKKEKANVLPEEQDAMSNIEENFKSR